MGLNNRQKQFIVGGTTWIIAMSVYLLTMPRDVTWAHFGGDGGELITASFTLGVPHPSGYPTYVLLGKLFSFLPIGNVAFRYHLLSATAVSLAASFLTLTIYALNAGVQPQVGQRRREENVASLLVAVAGGLLFAFVPLVWGQAIIAEVYGLNLLFVSLFLWALLTKRPFGLTGLLLGLAITTHLTSLIFIPMAIILTPKSGWAKMGIGFFIGLTPFLLIPLLARGSSPIVWGTPTTWHDWWWLVSGTVYRPNQLAFADINFVSKAQTWFPQISWLLAVVIIGLLINRTQRRRGTKKASPQPPVPNPRPLLTITAVILCIYTYTYNSTDSIVLILPAVLLLCLLLAPMLTLLEGFSLALPLLLLLLNFSSVNLRNDSGIRPYAEELLAATPPRAILLTNGDPTLFSLWYFHFVEEQRPDIAIVDYHLFGFDWYRERLVQTYPDLIVPTADDLATLQADNERTRPYCRADIISEHNQPKIMHSCSEGLQVWP